MANSSQYGAFVPTNWIWDIQKIHQIKDIDPELRELLVRLYQNLNLMALVLNVKDTGQYPVMETVNSQLWFPNPANNSSTAAVAAERQVLRKVINWGKNLPNATADTVPHGITCTPNTTFTRIYGASSDTTGFNYIPLPYSSPTLVENIELKLDANSVTIVTGSNRSNFNITYVILEYIQT